MTVHVRDLALETKSMRTAELAARCAERAIARKPRHYGAARVAGGLVRWATLDFHLRTAGGFDADDAAAAAPEGETACRFCGCTDSRACEEGCSWLEKFADGTGRCSSCRTA